MDIVGRIISGIDDRGTPDNKREWQEAIRFKRVDMKDSPEILADIDHVIDISRGTTIAVGDAQVKTVEHVLAAIMGCEIDNIVVELTTNEPPVIDGSAKPFVDILREAGFREQNAPKDYLVIDELVHYHNDKSEVDIVAMPLDDFKMTVMIDYRNPALGSQYTGLFSLENEFATEFAPAQPSEKVWEPTRSEPPLDANPG